MDAILPEIAEVAASGNEQRPDPMDPAAGHFSSVGLTGFEPATP
jgi:hypothetical protein